MTFDPTDRIEVVNLKTGDYSITCGGQDYRNCVAIERKSLSDLFSSLGSNRLRFEAELERLRAFECSAIVIEANMEDVMQGIPFSGMKPTAVMGSLLTWYVRWGVAPIFTGNRVLAAATVRKILTKFVEMKSKP